MAVYRRFIPSIFEPFPQNTQDEYRSLGYLPYQPAYYKFFLQSVRNLKKLGLDISASTFLDIGAGKGKILMLAMALDFNKVIGIEIENKYSQICEKRIAEVKKNYGNRIYLYKGDAADFVPEEIIDVVFLYNPFRPYVLARVLDNFASKGHLPRFIIYANPVGESILESIGYLPRYSGTTGLHKEYTVYQFGDSAGQGNVSY